MSDAGGVTPPPAPNPASNTPPPWYGVLANEALGHVQSRGWDKLDATAAALEAVKGHVSATQMLGVPVDQLIRMPKDAADEAGWKAVWSKLGAPDKPEGYSFEGISFEDESSTTAFVGKMREAAAKLNVPAPMAAALAKAAFEHITGLVSAADAESAAAVQEAEAALKQNWGQNYDANKFVSDRGAQVIAERMGARLGAKVPELVQLARDSGFGEVVAEMMRVVGAGYGEDKIVTSPTGGGNAMTRDQAMARKAELMGNGRMGSGDVEFQKRYQAGDAAARREILALNTLIAGTE